MLWYFHIFYHSFRFAQGTNKLWKMLCPSTLCFIILVWNSNTLQSTGGGVANLVSTPHIYMCRHPYKHKQVGHWAQTLIIGNKPCLFSRRMTVNVAIPNVLLQQSKVKKHPTFQSNMDVSKKDVDIRKQLLALQKWWWFASITWFLKNNLLIQLIIRNWWIRITISQK